MSKTYLWILPLLSFMVVALSGISYANQTVRLANVTEFEIQPDRLDTPLKLYVITPKTYDAAKSYPVMYAFDADLSLGMMTTLTALVSRTAKHAGLRPPIVVSIGYGSLKKAFARRLHDLTPSADEYDLPERPNGKKWPKVGGGDKFLDVLIQDIKPFIKNRYAIDTSAETLYGHSLGGLLTLHALVHYTDDFNRFAAASPSLWFNNRKIMNDLQDFHTGQGLSSKTTRLRLTVGSEEEQLSGWSEEYSPNKETRRKWLKKNRMVSNAKQLRDFLASQEGNIDLEFKIYGGLEHAIANAPAFYDALRFAIEP